MSKQTRLHKKIMRRVYISYTLSFTEQPLLWCGLVLGGAVALLGRWTHVASVMDNTLAKPVVQMPGYMVDSFLSAIARGELGTVLVILTIASVSAVVVWQLAHLRFGQALQVA